MAAAVLGAAIVSSVTGVLVAGDAHAGGGKPAVTRPAVAGKNWSRPVQDAQPNHKVGPAGTHGRHVPAGVQPAHQPGFSSSFAPAPSGAAAPVTK